MSQATPLPRSMGPLSDALIASSGGITATFRARARKISFPESSPSPFAIVSRMGPMNSRTSPSNPSGSSKATPPMRM